MRLTQARRRLFGDLIGIRIMRGISQAEVARAIGINRSGVSRFESDVEGSNPTMDVVLRYAHAVGANIEMRAELAEETEARERLLEHVEVHVANAKWRLAVLPHDFADGFAEPGSFGVAEEGALSDEGDWTVAELAV